jgi:hypothetical protein
LTEREALIDLAEWAEVQDRELPGGHRWGFSASLWTWLETLPWREVGKTDRNERAWTAFGAANRALEGALKAHPEGLPSRGVVVDFATGIPSRSSPSGWAVLRLHAEPSPELQLSITVGLSGDFRSHPLEPGSALVTAASVQ